MDIISKKDNDKMVVSVKGKMDAVTAPEFEKKMKEWISQSICRFVIDLSALEYISSAGLRSILITARELKNCKGKMVISSINGAVKNVFEISGFTTLFEVFDSVENALKKM
jgi:anti-sigma B factor antagonist